MTQGTMIDSKAGQHRGKSFMPPVTTSTYVDALVDPGGVFRDPAEIAEHPWFTREEKRTILLSWTRNELVLEQVANRSLPELKPRSRIDAVIDTLAQFDAHAASEYRSAVGAIRTQKTNGRCRAFPFKARRA